jgi:hypothetical protein
MGSPSKIQHLVDAGLIRAGHQFSDQDRQLLESLSDDEVEALISVKTKLGEDFFNRNTALAYPPVGIVF